MSEPFLAEIKIVGFNFAPRGWAFLDGQILPISQNQSLYSLLGTTYGGDGRTSFALPDLRGRTPLHWGAAEYAEHSLGQKGGAESVALTVAEMPQHNHLVKASMNTGNTPDAKGSILAGSAGPTTGYRSNEQAHRTSLRSGSIANTGGSQAHENMQPYIAVNFCIALQGLFPSRN